MAHMRVALRCVLSASASREGKTMNRGGFSWNRVLGITNAKQRVSRATGIPWTKSGTAQGRLDVLETLQIASA
jgi:hypothetical protein